MKNHLLPWKNIVPNPPQTLVRFVREFRNRVKPDQRPILVHCSAGVGRSGTFIALDRILQQIKVCDYVDIFNIVYTMRKGWLNFIHFELKGSRKSSILFIIFHTNGRYFIHVAALERVWMVQTETQYICIYQCLMVVLEGKESLMNQPREIHDNQGYEGT